MSSEFCPCTAQTPVAQWARCRWRRRRRRGIVGCLLPSLGESKMGECVRLVVWCLLGPVTPERDQQSGANGSVAHVRFAGRTSCGAALPTPAKTLQRKKVQPTHSIPITSRFPIPYNCTHHNITCNNYRRRESRKERKKGRK